MKNKKNTKTTNRFYIAIFRHHLAEEYPNIRFYRIVGTFSDYVTAYDRFATRFSRDFTLLGFDDVDDFLQWKKTQKDFELYESIKFF